MRCLEEVIINHCQCVSKNQVTYIMDKLHRRVCEFHSGEGEPYRHECFDTGTIGPQCKVNACKEHRNMLHPKPEELHRIGFP